MSGTGYRASVGFLPGTLHAAVDIAIAIVRRIPVVDDILTGEVEVERRRQPVHEVVCARRGDRFDAQDVAQNGYAAFRFVPWLRKFSTC